MNAKERVYRTLSFGNPDRIPIDIWSLKSADAVYGDQLRRLITQGTPDIAFLPLQDPTQDPRRYDIGEYTDVWGCEWQNKQYGIIGEVKKYPLEDNDVIADYRSPLNLLREKKQHMLEHTQGFISEHSDQFILSGWNSLFERMQFLRGTENLFIDIAEESDEFFAIRNIVLEYCCEYAEICSDIDGVDGCVIGDDWGSQISSLISLPSWRKLFKPAYEKIINIMKAHDKKVFVHSDGYILDYYDEWKELGVDAINSQLTCMGLEKVAEKVKGLLTIWGELDRQYTMPRGTVAEVKGLIDRIKSTFYHNGGIIGQFEINSDMPIENIECGIFGWQK